MEEAYYNRREEKNETKRKKRIIPPSSFFFNTNTDIVVRIPRKNVHRMHVCLLTDLICER